MKNKNWIRLLYVELAQWGSTEWHVYGKTIDDSHKPHITISGNKYLSPVKDNFTVKIYNLPFTEIAKIQLQKLFHIQIFCGYLGGQQYNAFDGKRIFDGGIVNIVNQKTEYKDNIVTLVCASKLVAKAQEWRCNISFNSGINMYSAMKYIGKQAGLTNMNISDSFKHQYFEVANKATGSASSYLDKLSSTNNTQFFSADNSEGADFSAHSSREGGMRQIVIDPAKGMMIGSAPKLTSSGLNWTSLPVFNYLPGDLCQIDNSLIDTSQGQDSLSGTTSTPNTVYLNQQGLYYIFDLGYELDNTDGSFQVNIHAKTKDLFDNVTGYTNKSTT